MVKPEFVKVQVLFSVFFNNFWKHKQNLVFDGFLGQRI